MRIPGYQRRVKMQPLPGAQQRLNVNPIAFGQQNTRAMQSVGNGMQRLGKGIIDVASYLQNEEVKTETLQVTTAFNELRREASEYMDSEIFTKQGANAQTVQKDAMAKLGELKDKYSENLNERQRNQLNKVFDEYQTSMHKSVGGFQRRERDKAMVGNHESIISIHSDDAVKHPDQAGVFMPIAEASLKAVGKMQGWTEAQFADKKAQMYSDVRVRTFQSIMAKGDVKAAEAYYDEHKSDILGINRPAIEGALKRSKVNLEVQESMEKFVPPATLAMGEYGENYDFAVQAGVDELRKRYSGDQQNRMVSAFKGRMTEQARVLQDKFNKSFVSNMQALRDMPSAEATRMIAAIENDYMRNLVSKRYETATGVQRRANAVAQALSVTDAKRDIEKGYAKVVDSSGKAQSLKLDSEDAIEAYAIYKNYGTTEAKNLMKYFKNKDNRVPVTQVDAVLKSVFGIKDKGAMKLPLLQDYLESALQVDQKPTRDWIVKNTKAFLNSVTVEDYGFWHSEAKTYGDFLSDKDPLHDMQYSVSELTRVVNRMRYNRAVKAGASPERARYMLDQHLEPTALEKYASKLGLEKVSDAGDLRFRANPKSVKTRNFTKYSGME